MGATEHRMETTYPVTITHFTILPQLFVTYTRGEALSAQDWEGYLVRHGSSLARFVARLPCLRFLTLINFWPYDVVHYAILLQPCRQLVSIIGAFELSGSLCCLDIPRGPHPERDRLLHLAMARGHLPSFNRLLIQTDDGVSIIAEAFRAGHLNRVRELKIKMFVEREQLLPLMKAFQAFRGKIEALELEINESSDLGLLAELATNSVCSDLRKLEVMPERDDDFFNAMLPVCEYLIRAGAERRPLLRKLSVFIEYPAEVTSMADALLLGGAGARLQSWSKSASR